MDDFSAEDMRYGDLSETQLKERYYLLDISTRANPYTLTKFPPLNQAELMFQGFSNVSEKITPRECAKILFDEFRQLSRSFSVYGPYRHLIETMITHLQNGKGTSFSSIHLNSALKEQILNDKTDDSSLLRIKNALISNIDWGNNLYPENKMIDITVDIAKGKLPKFNRFQDNYNGMGITVHDTWATHITINSLQIEKNRFRAVVNYKIQDHFGLDSNDITRIKFNQFRLFRIWFVLQRYNLLGYRPFLTNMEATVEIVGVRDEEQK